MHAHNFISPCNNDQMWKFIYKHNNPKISMEIQFLSDLNTKCIIRVTKRQLLSQSGKHKMKLLYLKNY